MLGLIASIVGYEVLNSMLEGNTAATNAAMTKIANWAQIHGQAQAEKLYDAFTSIPELSRYSGTVKDIVSKQKRAAKTAYDNQVKNNLRAQAEIEAAQGDVNTAIGQSGLRRLVTGSGNRASEAVSKISKYSPENFIKNLENKA